MNQILYVKQLEICNRNANLVLRYKIIFYISIINLLIFIIYYSVSYIDINKKEQLSSKILSAYDIQSLYSASNSVPPNIILENGESAEIFGILEIDKINLRYPVLSTFSDELLKFSPCKFYGDNLNKIGNICIAGHNYDNNSFFSNIHLLEIGDVITIYNLSGTATSYIIYDKFETVPTDVSCINQDTLYKEVTLITCNNYNNKRLIIKAKNR